MSSKVRFDTGEPIEVRDSKTFVDGILEGPDIYHATATDTHGNSHEAGGRSQEAAEDKAIFGLLKNRGDD
jgi:hypothetical protein